MKTYPSIGTKIDYSEDYIVFQKLDGSNIRAEWSKKQGFYKFGTRTRLLGEDQPLLMPSKELILEKYGDDLEYRFKHSRYERAIVFFEYFGPNSFAGHHSEEDIANGNQDVVLIDVAPYKKGILNGNDFLDFCKGIHYPEIIHEGSVSTPLIEDIRSGKYIDVSFEGAVLKRRTAKHFKPAKVKTIQWLDKLKNFCGDNTTLFEKLK